jgi:hypothetical protein
MDGNVHEISTGKKGLITPLTVIVIFVDMRYLQLLHAPLPPFMGISHSLIWLMKIVGCSTSVLPLE